MEAIDRPKTLTTLVYALQAAGFLLPPVVWIVAVIINYVRKEEVAGTWLESHFRWQIRTFWFGLLWGVIGATASSRAGSISRRTGRCPRKADFLGVGKDVILKAGAHALLLAQPKRWIEQVAVVLVEHLARARVAHQEALELLRKHVARAHRPVRLRRDLVCVVAGRRYAPKDHVGHGRDLVVVVEHDALVPGDAEVLEQHVAGKDSCAGEFLDPIAVVVQRLAQPGPVAVAAQLLDMQVEWPHAPLDVDMPDHELVAVELELRADLAQIGRA